MYPLNLNFNNLKYESNDVKYQHVNSASPTQSKTSLVSDNFCDNDSVNTSKSNNSMDNHYNIINNQQSVHACTNQSPPFLSVFQFKSRAKNFSKFKLSGNKEITKRYDELPHMATKHVLCHKVEEMVINVKQVIKTQQINQQQVDLNCDINKITKDDENDQLLIWENVQEQKILGKSQFVEFGQGFKKMTSSINAPGLSYSFKIPTRLRLQDAIFNCTYKTGLTEEDFQQELQEMDKRCNNQEFISNIKAIMGELSIFIVQLYCDMNFKNNFYSLMKVLLKNERFDVNYLSIPAHKFIYNGTENKNETKQMKNAFKDLMSEMFDYLGYSQYKRLFKKKNYHKFLHSQCSNNSNYKLQCDKI